MLMGSRVQTLLRIAVSARMRHGDDIEGVTKTGSLGFWSSGLLVVVVLSLLKVTVDDDGTKSTLYTAFL